AITMLNLDHTATAEIAGGAQINQDMALRSGAQAVTVEATSVNEAFHLGGNISLPGLQGSKKSFKIDTGALKPGVGTESSEGAIGATVMVFDYDNTVSATIGDGVTLYADSLEVDAETLAFSIAVGASGGSSDNFGFNGVFV